MIIHGDCLEEMRKMEENSISAIVTDPPYGLSFMGKGWDHGIPNKTIWSEILRIAKPGSYLLSFGGTRTFHRLTCAIEDAGWEIRDCLMWIYGSGFPKSHNHFGIDGYGTALKPAWEPIIMAMKPCDGTFKQNAEKWGQAGINIEDSRVDDKRWPANLILDEFSSQMLDEQSGLNKSKRSFRGKVEIFKKENSWIGTSTQRGHDDSGGASRFFYCAKASSRERNDGLEGLELKKCSSKQVNSKDRYENGNSTNQRPSEPIRQNNHPTVKPLKLMEYLIKLIMPPKDGILLDPFAGSGTTILAAKNLGYEAIGIEKDEGYCEIARKRLENTL